MNQEFREIEGFLARARAVVLRASEVVAKAQTDKHPYCILDDSVRIYAAILATQARELAERASKQVGVTDKVSDADRLDVVYDFFADSAAHVGTRPVQMQAARTAALRVLVDMSETVIAQAERVIERDESIDGVRLYVTEELLLK